MLKLLQDIRKIFNAIIYTIRPSATLGACILVLAALNPEMSDWQPLVFLMLATFFGGAYCFLVNDIFDRKKDLANEKFRPIATGVLPLHVAKGVSMAFALIFMTICWFLGQIPFILSVVFLLLASFYSYINLKTGLLANVVVALIVSGTQWGVWVIKPDDYLWLSSIFLFLFTIPREILLDYLDVSGDQKIGKRSLPIQLSERKLSWVMSFFLLLASASLVLLITTEQRNTTTIILLTITILSVWISFWRYFKKPNHQTALYSVRLSHITFALLILALLSR
ncbi:UbiA prenyltransferase family protein [Ekhidna sp.]|uniref:UbiA prenyltransferase family protein n=1 Tax=Ekhidna sp. TaxID=2608089 RepID=UPI003B515129